MSNRRDDILLIRKYLNGELDTRAMHRLERTAQDDPFLMDALEGYHIGTDQQANLQDLANKLHSRVHRFQRKTLLLWPLIGAITSVLGFVILGAWWILVYLPAANKSEKNINYRTEAVTKSVHSNPRPSTPHTRSISGTLTDTVRTDTAIKKPVDTAKTTIKPNRKHDLVKGSVDPSTVIADLNKQPYSTAKHKKPAAVTHQNAADKPVAVKQTTPEKGTSPVNKNSVITSAVPAADVNTGNALKNSKQLMVQNTPGNIANNVAVVSSNKSIAEQAARNTGVLQISKDKTAPANTTAAPNQPQQSKSQVVSRGNTDNLAASSNSSFKTVRVDPNVVLKNNEVPTITGQVIASDDGRPIAGVALRIMGTETGTVTDAKGRFSIRMAKTQTLQANFIGFYGKQVTPAGTDIKITLQPLSNGLNTMPVNTTDKTTISENKATSNLNVAETKSAPSSAIINNKNTPGLNTADSKAAATSKTTGTSAIEVKINPNPIMHVNGRVLAFATNLPIQSMVMWNKTANEQYRLENDGMFDIVVHKGDEIYVGHTGFKTQKVKIRNKIHFDIILEENNSTLFDGFVKGLTFTPYDDTAHPLMGWNKFKSLQNIKSADGKTGTVKITFTINANNSVSNIQVTKSVSPLADSAAVQIIRDKTKWMHNTNNQPENVSVKFKVQ